MRENFMRMFLRELKSAMLVTVTSVLLMYPATGMSMTDLDTILDQIESLQEAGKIEAAKETASKAIASRDWPAEQKRQLEYEIVRSDRILLDYRQTKEDLLETLTRRVEDFSPDEFDNWFNKGYFDFKVIEGEMRFVGPSVSNLFKRYPEEFNNRRTREQSYTWRNFLLEHARRVKKEVHPSAEGTGAPRRMRINMSISVKPDIVPEGETIRCWMPFPQEISSQEEIELFESSPEVTWMNNPTYPHRSLYFEQESNGSEETVFEASYSVALRPRYYDIDADLVAATDQTMLPERDYFTSEQLPHVVLSERVRDLASEITEDHPNPAVRARRIYDWIGENKRYSFAREYSTLHCISEYVLDNGYGDCGQIALLFITLCRAADVPARWQSGWVVYPQYQGLHDWSEIYLAPYGWVPVDADFGMSIAYNFENYSESEVQEMRDFYFGGVDAYRLAINSDHGYPHYPPKEDFRSDNVDFQRGELEANGKNIYFGQFRYNLDAVFLDPESKTAYLNTPDEEKATASAGSGCYPGQERVN